MRAGKLLSLLAFSVALCGCLKPVRSEDDPNHITVWEQEDSTVAPYIDATLEAFRKLPGNERVTISRVHYSNEDLRQQYQTAAIAGTGPDLIMCPSDFGGVFAVAGFILPVDGLFDLSIYNNAVMESVQLEGKHWGIPTSNGNHLMFMYNKKFVKNVPQNTDELFRYCDTEGKKYGLQNCLAFDGGEPFWFTPWLGGFGGWPLDKRAPTLDTRPMREAVDFYLDLRYGKKVIPQECDYNCMDALFKEEKVAFIINGDWSVFSYAASLKDNYGVARIPMVSKTGLWPSPMVSGKFFMINARLQKDERKLKLARELVKFYTNRENQVRQVKELKRLPSLTEANTDQSVVGDPLLKASMEQILVGKPMPMATEMRPTWDSMRQYLGKIMTRKVTAEEGITKMQQDVSTKIGEMNR